MKKYIIVLFCAWYAAQATSASLFDRKHAPDHGMGISLSPLQLFLFSVNGKYWLKLHEQVALTIPFIITSAPELSLINRSQQVSSGLGLKYCFTGSIAQGGFYSELGANAGYSIVTPPQSASFSSAFVKAAAYLGYSWRFADRFMLNVAPGFAYNHAFSHEARAIKRAFTVEQQIRFASEGLSSGFYPTGELSLGYNW